MSEPENGAIEMIQVEEQREKRCMKLLKKDVQTVQSQRQRANLEGSKRKVTHYSQKKNNAI